MAVARPFLPFTALVGQESMKQALVLNAVNPAIGGVLIRGEKGTAKSTAVRALARLLPDIDVVADCPYNCPPDQGEVQCADCRARVAAGETLPVARRQMRVVDLPINASEDRVVGTIDIEAAIKHGERRFEPGVLAEANRNILYVDEVNLLDDHLVDVLLDAAAMGVNVVEREGISVWHPARFILVGTMNPEEGELRPQLLDRFGLCVDVRGLRDVVERVRVMEQEARRGTEALADECEVGEQRLRDVILKAEELLPLVEVPATMRHFASLVCVDAGALGHRADIVVTRTARTLAAAREAEHLVLEGPGEVERTHPLDALQVTAPDVVRAAELALVHRRRDKPQQDQPGDAGIADRARDRLRKMEQPSEGAETESEPQEGQPSEGGGGGGGGDGVGHQSPENAQPQEGPAGAPQMQFEGSLFPVRRIQLPRDRKTRRTPGKRSLTRSGDKRGRYVRSTTVERTTDLAFDATLRAAAPHQPSRHAAAAEAAVTFEGRPDPAMALRLERQDLRQKVRQRRTGTLIVFVVDASASMDAEQRMQATKGAVLSLLRDAYVRRDKVALVVFSGRTARVVLRPTSSVDLAESRLQRLTVGGTTPLTHGLVAGLKLIHTERLRDPSVYPLMVLISDGRGNISLFGEEPLVEAQRVAAQIRQEKIRSLVIDSARDYTQHIQLPRIGGAPRSTPMFGGYSFNACLDLAERLGGRYFGLYDLSQGSILQTVQESLRERN
ncbi:MAG TPA: magnesium chelatase subunit D family protein [Candidatus Dormibacteraeota bacterium]|nr:magnesium chelatase subunit D family protein [Candidatus Dormibacteraeota bacterium]